MEQASQRGTMPILKRSGAPPGKRRLVFVDPLVYPACVGYRSPAVPARSPPAGESQDLLRFGSFAFSPELGEMTVTDSQPSLSAARSLCDVPATTNALVSSSPSRLHAASRVPSDSVNPMSPRLPGPPHGPTPRSCNNCLGAWT
jgi:hypothetical protein